MTQEDVGAGPALVRVGPAAVIRFDGIDDHLSARKLGLELKSFTLVIVAAPRANIGSFRGLLALNAAKRNDYETGLTVDLGPTATAQFSVLNVEGGGVVGARNLRTRDDKFGQLHLLIVRSATDGNSVKLMVDGQWEGEQPRDGASLALDELNVGARYYKSIFGPEHLDGFASVDVAEVALYSRALADAELGDIQKYVDSKYAEVQVALSSEAGAHGEALQAVADPPPVQVFVPGFSVRQLPIELTNVNNVKYRDDGTLVAVGYDGRIWLLRDKDGDGLEETAELFWANESGLRSPIGMDLTPSGYPHGDGVFVVGKTRCVLVVDADGDDQADKEIQIAGGWKESFHQVDGLGVAYNPRDGSIYFGRGTYNFADPLLRDKDGKSQYNLKDESGAIIHVSPDFKTREIVATGIRFPVAIRLNRHGDLFATDQEGATWVPNGNPFDELLHVQQGRHYGFPARHPIDLPGVIDEPSTFDYGPQHQSTCGLNFNEPVRPDGPVFGPELWAGDAIVSGYSRGKLYRTQLVKSTAGYVARTQLFACLKMLTVDACICPKGGLVVACHSGGPDWGSGPTGMGKLFKIDYTGRDEPQPVVAWPAGPHELRVEFDRRLDPRAWQRVLERSKLTAGRYVRAGDRFESLWPGYAAVQSQKLAPRFDVPLRSVQLTADNRTLVLATDSMTKAHHYALTLPDDSRVSPHGTDILSQHAAIDLDFDMTGCAAMFRSTDRKTVWTGWLPHLDLDVCRRLTAGSAAHDALWRAMECGGELELRCQLDLVDMLRPAVQPGSTIDYEYPPEEVTVSFKSPTANATLSLHASSGTQAAISEGQQSSITVHADEEKQLDVEILTEIAADDSPSLVVHWTTNEDHRPRPLPLRRIFVPWADLSESDAERAAPQQPPELEGGNWARGRRVFFSEQAACAKCHAIYGCGGSIGPNLSNLIHRDYASVLRDIANPSFAINPDYLPSAVTLTNGRVLVGVVHTHGDTLLLGDVQGNITELVRAEVDSLEPSSVSTMPEGLPKQLGPAQMRDLLTFLLTPPPHMPRDLGGSPPTKRTREEVRAVLAGAPDPPERTRPIHLLLVAGLKDHGPGEHDYPAWLRAWSELLASSAGVTVSTAWEWPNRDELRAADVAIFYQHGDWNADRADDIDAFLERGGGLVYIHWAVDGREMGQELAKRIGLAAGGAVAFRHGNVTLTFHREARHPILRNLDSLKLTDETYWKLLGDLPAESVLASAVEDGRSQPQVWTIQPRRGRVFVCIPGHYSWTFDDPLYRILLLRGIAWTAGEPVDRFNELVWPGAEVAN